LPSELPATLSGETILCIHPDKPPLPEPKAPNRAARKRLDGPAGLAAQMRRARYYERAVNLAIGLQEFPVTHLSAHVNNALLVKDGCRFTGKHELRNEPTE